MHLQVTSCDFIDREKILIEEIHNLYGPEVMELIEKKEDMEGNIDSLKNTVQLTELIIKGKDMELLLLQKEIQEKLQAFSKTTVSKELPKAVKKVIHFVPGMLDMGYIHDADRPLLSQTRHRFSHQGSNECFDPSDFFDTVETQTEGAPSKESATNTDIKVRCDGITQTMENLNTNGYSLDHGYQPIYSNGNVSEETQTDTRRRRRRREREVAVETETMSERQARRAQRLENCDID